VRGARRRTRRTHLGVAFAVCLAAAAILIWPVGNAPAAAASPQTWAYTQGVGTGAAQFQLEPLADGTFGTGLTVVDVPAGQTLDFQLGAADVSGAPDPQVTDTPFTLPFDIPLSGSYGQRKTFYDLGGTLDLGGNAGVTVALSYSVGNGSGPVRIWRSAGVANGDTFKFALSGDPVGKTIAYQVTITAPAVVMSTPVVISNITIIYGAATTSTAKPKPKPSRTPTHKPTPHPSATGTGGSGGRGNDTGSSATHTGNGDGTGAGNGDGGGNVSGATAHAKPAAKPPVPTQARATTNVALPRSTATGSTGLVSGYMLAAPLAVAPPATVAGDDTRESGGHAQGGGGAGAPHELAYLALGACLLFAVVVPWPFTSRRLRALAAFEHEQQAAAVDGQEWVEEPAPPV